MSLAERHDRLIHLLLSDMVMPGMNGAELADRLLRSRPPAKALFMSGYMDPSVEAQALSKSAVPLLMKPFTPESLLGRVREALDAKLSAVEHRVEPQLSIG